MPMDPQRETRLTTLFPHGIPRLWCPVLTHFRSDRSIDADRMAAHFESLSPFVKGIMLPGSTGEGWDLTESQNGQLLRVALRLARQYGLRVLIGVLRRELSQMLAVIEGTVSWLCEETQQPSGMAAMLNSNVVGFTVCPPTGSELTDREIHDALAAVLELGHPTALYQLPQVTQNEMSPEVVGELAGHYPNFYLFKDTSGTDRVALSGVDLLGVYLVRGAEGEYHRWLRASGGAYDGFLLSTANGFAPQLAEVVELSSSRPDEAQRLAQRVQRAVERCFQIVDGHPAANPFTNANKLVDQVMALGDQALTSPPPYLSTGDQLPLEFVAQAWEALQQQQLLPAHRYL